MIYAPIAGCWPAFASSAACRAQRLMSPAPPAAANFYFVNVEETFFPLSRTNVYELFAFASITRRMSRDSNFTFNMFYVVKNNAAPTVYYLRPKVRFEFFYPPPPSGFLLISTFFARLSRFLAGANCAEEQSWTVRNSTGKFSRNLSIKFFNY